MYLQEIHMPQVQHHNIPQNLHSTDKLPQMEVGISFVPA